MLMLIRFEKSLYDLIRGLRNHKGNEREYIQSCLKECRSEIRSQDMGSSTAAPCNDMKLTPGYRRQGHGLAQAGLP